VFGTNGKPWARRCAPCGGCEVLRHMVEKIRQQRFSPKFAKMLQCKRFYKSMYEKKEFTRTIRKNILFNKEIE